MCQIWETCDNHRCFLVPLDFREIAAIRDDSNIKGTLIDLLIVMLFVIKVI